MTWKNNTTPDPAHHNTNTNKQPPMESQDECSGETIVPLRYIHPHFALTMEDITRCRDDNLRRSLAHNKLHLVLDLDHTLLHARPQHKLTLQEKQLILSTPDAYEIFDGRYVVKLRPGLADFIKQVSTMFDLSIYTMGSRSYAQAVHHLLESKVGFPESSWVIAKEDCTTNRQKSLDVVLAHENLAVIVDDTKEVWAESCRKNLVQIARYDFFPIKKVVKEVEDEVDTELARVLSILKGVHDAFYDGSVEVDEGAKDVRDMLDLVPPNLRLQGSHSYEGDESHIGLKRPAGLSEEEKGACAEKKCKRLVIKFNGNCYRTSTSEEKSRLLYDNIVIDAPPYQQNTCIAPPIRKKLVIKCTSGLAH